MNFKLLLCALLLCGCQREPATGTPKQTTAQRWDYETVVVDNNAHWGFTQASQELETNSDEALKLTRYAQSKPGEFNIGNGSMMTANGYDTNGMTLEAMGNEGWELVAAVPQTETVPDAEYAAGLDYHDGQLGGEKYEPFNNIRTGKVILIFKRPQ